MAFSITLQNVANFCSTQADLMPLSGVGGYQGEPFLTIANDALSDLLTSDNDWKFNRIEMPMLVTCPQKQDYQFAGATVFSLDGSAQGWSIDLASKSAITVTSGTVQVGLLETGHRFTVGQTVYLNNVQMSGTSSAYNSVFSDNGSTSQWSHGYVVTAVGSKSLSFTATTGQNNGDTGGAPGINDFGFLSSGSAVQMTDTSSPQYSVTLNAYREQPVTNRVANPENVSVMTDNYDGTLKLRFHLCPGSTIWGAKLVYQAQAPVKTALSNNWAPFPDHYSAVYRQAVVYRMYRYLNSPRAEVEYEKLQHEIAKAQGADDAEASSVYVTPEEPIMSGDFWWGF